MHKALVIILVLSAAVQLFAQEPDVRTEKLNRLIAANDIDGDKVMT